MVRQHKGKCTAFKTQPRRSPHITHLGPSDNNPNSDLNPNPYPNPEPDPSDPPPSSNPVSRISCHSELAPATWLSPSPSTPPPYLHESPSTCTALTRHASRCFCAVLLQRQLPGDLHPPVGVEGLRSGLGLAYCIRSTRMRLL